MKSNADYKRLFGLIGYPLGHSFSQDFFNQKFASEGVDAKYVNFELPTIGVLPEILAHNPNLCGFNVTIPYKETVFDFLDAVDSEARAIGAVNVVKVFRQPDGSRTLKGYNSDVIGFGDSIAPFVTEGNHRKALILGTGGAAKAVAFALGKLGIESTMVSRHRAPQVLTYAQLTPAVVKEHTIIVNCTPLGMYPNVDQCPDIPYEALTPAHLCYDLLYNPDVTMFMRRSADMGATVKNGLEMLLLQAFVSWAIWNK